MQQYLIAGLGNPGSKYQWTRHNAGFLFLDRLAHTENLSITKKVFSGLSGEWRFNGDRLFLLKPETFMNLSGRAVMQALQFYKIPPTNLIVVHDELDLPFGEARLKQGGGSAGHNGLKSISELLGRSDFIRLRIGIDRPVHGDTVNYVLGNFPPVEMEKIIAVFDGAADMLKMMLTEGIAKAMSLYNKKNFLEG